MAEDHGAPRPERTALWTRLFSAFRIALDAKKLLLAAGGILATAFAWWLLSALFYSTRGKPEWKNYAAGELTPAQLDERWKDFKAARIHWNMMHEMAARPGSLERVEPADVAQSRGEFGYLEEIDIAYRRWQAPIDITETDKQLALVLPTEGKKSYAVTLLPAGDKEARERFRKGAYTVGDLKLLPRDGGDETVMLANTFLLKVEKNLEDLKKFREGAQTLAQLRVRFAALPEPQRREALAALDTYERELRQPTFKRAGRLRTWPFFENRGPNPYLLVTSSVTSAGSGDRRATPAAGSGLLRWFVVDQAPVLLEPLFKFLTPVVYLFDARAGGWEYLYLILVILSTLAIWGFFGGAITRLAAVQFARNERITLVEALRFAQDRFVSYFAAPVFPLLAIAILVLCLWLFGLLELIPLVGDVIVAGLFWPLVLAAGFVMAIVLVGLVGWPLMNATISTEGSDSFDALSRSYSYVYQAPWQYLWYSFLALVYGAALVFFVSFMASMMVYLGKWGVAQTPGMDYFNREPSYLFRHAPTSFGWRDLLIHDSPNVERAAPGAAPRLEGFEFRKDYVEGDNWHWWNTVGSVLVSAWLYLFFLLVIGFSYSYFWTASTIIYFLMRRQVDDTDLDEVHLEGEDLDDPFARPSPPPPAAPAKPGTVSLTTVEAPALRTGVTPTPPATTPTSPAPASPPTSSGDGQGSTASPPSDPGAASKKTMLAPGPDPVPQPPRSTDDGGPARGGA